MKRRRIAAGLVAGIIAEAANKLVPLLTLHFAATRLGVTPFGHSQFSQWIVDLGTFVVALGFSGWAQIACKDADAKKRRQIFSSIVIARVALASVSMLGLAWTVHNTPGWQEYAYLVIPSLFVIFFSAFDSLWAVVLTQSLPRFSIIATVAKLCSLAAVFALVSGPDDALAYTVIMNASNALISLASFVYALKRFGFALPGIGAIGQAFKYSFTWSILTILWVTAERLDLAIVEYFFGPTGAGTYGGPMRVAFSLTPVVGIISTVFFSEMLATNERSSHQAHIRAGMRTALLILLPIVAGIWFFDREIIRLTLGEDFVIGAPVLSVLCFAIVPQLFSMVFGTQVLALHRRIGLCNLAILIGLGTTISLALIFGSRAELSDIAGFNLIGRLVAAAFATYFAMRVTESRLLELFRDVLTATLPTVCMLGFLGVMRKFGPPLDGIHWLFVAAAGAIVYTICAGLIFRATFRDLWQRFRASA